MSSEGIDLNDAGWKYFGTEGSKRLGIYPNQLWRKDGDGVLVVWKAQAHEQFPMNKAGVEYVVKANRESRIKGHVVLARRRDAKIEMVAVKAAEDVAMMVSGVVPKEGKFGAYWWVRPDFTLDGAGWDDEAPF